jgi:predicted PurR-regulated permease PerM
MTLVNVAAALLAAALVVVFLYYGRDVLVPLALTTLLSFALGPLVSWLRRFVGLRLAVTLAVLLAVLIIGGITFLLAWQVTDLAANLPKYRSNLLQKIDELRAGGGLIADTLGALRELANELTRPQTPVGPQPQPPPPTPMPVKIETATALDIVAAFLMPVVLPLLMAGVIVVLVVFMLLEREPLRDRLIRLISSGDISRTTEAINDAVERLSRFLATQVLVNIGFGTVVGVGLWLLGMPNPLVWGLLGAVLRFVPYAGSVITAVVPTLVAIAVAPGWTLPLLTFGLIVACEVIVGQVVEPLRYGSSTGMSPLAVLVSTMAWAALWGPIGLLLAMPITVCLIVIGRHVPQLEFLGVLLADEPALPTEAQLYHRLLAHSPFDAVEIAVEHARGHGVPDLVDKVLLPLLALAESDRRRGALDDERQHLIAEGIEEIVAALDEEADREPSPDDERPAASPSGPPSPVVSARVLCVGGRSDLDRAAAVLAAAVLGRRDIAAQACALGDLADVAVPDPQRRVAALAMCVVLPGSTTVIDHLLRRLRQQRVLEVPVVVGAFAPEGAATTFSAPGSMLASCSVGRTVTELADLVADALEHQRAVA